MPIKPRPGFVLDDDCNAELLAGGLRHVACYDVRGAAGGYGTIQRTGRLGYSCANAAVSGNEQQRSTRRLIVANGSN